MKTLRELGIEPSVALKGWEGRESALDLTPRSAIDRELLIETVGSMDCVESILAHYGGRIVFEGDESVHPSCPNNLPRECVSIIRRVQEAMNDRHKDIVRRLRAVYDPESFFALEVVEPFQYDLQILVRGEDHAVLEAFSLNDLLAIVRGVDIGGDDD